MDYNKVDNLIQDILGNVMIIKERKKYEHERGLAEPIYRACCEYYQGGHDMPARQNLFYKKVVIYQERLQNHMGEASHLYLQIHNKIERIETAITHLKRKRPDSDFDMQSAIIHESKLRNLLAQLRAA